MAKTYQVTGQVRFINRIMKLMIRLGIGPKQSYIMTVKGRKTGQPYSMPVSLVAKDGQRWLVAPYGEVNWVKNARAAGEVQLFRAGKTETVRVTELLESAERAVILKAYFMIEAFPRQFIDIPYDAPVAEFERIAPQHPVFLLA